MLKYPVYTEEEWYTQLDEKDKERVSDLIAAERMILNEAPIFELSRPNSMYIRFFVHRPFYADLEYMVYQIGRKVFVSVWFYFFPIIVLIIMYTIPLFNAQQVDEQ